MEIISFDDPVANTVPSANLISGDYVSSSPDPTVESKGAHTTEKPVSIIERIINSITSISTTISPDGTTKPSTTTSGQPTKTSAILNLVARKPKDKTITIDVPIESGAQKLTNSPNSVEYQTTEKPTTIIEKILSSLSAIRADAAQETTTADPLQVGSNYNTVDTTLKLSSTESTSSLAKTTIPMSKGGSSINALPLTIEGATILPPSTAFSTSTSASTLFDSEDFNDISTIPLRTSSLSTRSIPNTTPLYSQTSSTTLDPKNVFEEAVSDQILPKRTIDKLLSLLNIVSLTTTTPQPTTTKLVVVTPKLTTFVTSNTESISTEQNATPAPTVFPTTLELTSTIASSSLETTTPTLYTSTLATISDSTANDVNSVVNPLLSAEPTVGSRILDMISTISRIMASTLTPTTTSIPTSTITPEMTSIPNIPSTTPTFSTTAASTAGTSTTSFASTTTGVPETSAASTATASVTSSTVAGTSTTVPTTTTAATDDTATAKSITVATSAANPLAITTPITDSATVSTTSQTDSPISSSTTERLPTTIESIATTPNTVTTYTVGAPTTTQGTTNVPSSTHNVITSTVSSNTQTGATFMTTVNTTPALTSTTSTVAMSTTTSPQTEAASIGTTGSTIITSTTKFTRETTTDSIFDAPTTLPTLLNFEVSPDRVSVFSANDISSTFVPDDPASTTVSISARAFAPASTASTVTDNSPLTTTQNAIPTSQPTVGTTGVSSTTIASTSTAVPTVVASTTNSISSTTTSTVGPVANNTVSSSTVPPIITTTNSVKSDSTTQDVSSNTIDTNSVTDKQSLVNQSNVSNLVNPLSAGTNVSGADNSSMSSGLFVSPSLPDNSTTTTNPMVAMMEFMTRDGKLLRFQPNPLQNTIENNTRTKDYFIFAVLPNNTILRKRPSRYPSKETPFLIYGVLPNNTLIQKFPNGTIVPMEPVIQVVGFDTRENPPPPPEIISNQVTSDQDSRPDNNKVPTGGNTVPSIEANELSLNGGSSTAANALPPLTEILGGKTVKAFNSIVNQTKEETQAAKVQTLEVDPLTNRVRIDKLAHSRNAIFRWKPVTRPNLTPTIQQVQSRVNVDNVEINTISSASSSPPPPPTASPSSTTIKTVITTATSQAPTQPPGPPSTDAPFTTPLPLTTAVPVVSTAVPVVTTAVPVVTTQVTTAAPKIATSSPITTPLPVTNPPGPPATDPTTQKPVSTTGRIASTTFLPVFLTTLLSTLQPQTTTEPKLSSTTASIPEVTSTLSPVTTTLGAIPFTSPLSVVANPLSAAPDVDISPNSISTTTAFSPTLLDLLSNGATISSTPLPTTLLSSTVASLKEINLKQKQLTEQQKKDLEILEALEKEQAAILKQLAFLTGLNLGQESPAKNTDNLAERVIAKALERGKSVDGSTTISPPAFNLLEVLSPKDSRQSKSIAPAPSVEDLLKQININGLNSVTPAGPIVTSTYGKTNDALLASLLKEYGVGPPTPKVLSGAYDKEVSITTRAPKVSTTKRSVTTTQAPGRIMQGLNWLLNALAPPPSPKPTPVKPKPKPTPKAVNKPQEEVLIQQPTEITPVIVPAPDQPGSESKIENNIISQNQLMALVKQLEEIQKDPKKAKDLDIEALKALQNIESIQKSGVQVTAASSTGATSRTFVTTGAPKLSSTKAAATYTSPLPLSVSNNILEDVGPTPGAKGTIAPVDLKIVPGVAADLEAATTKSKIPPVKLNPVPGVPDENPRIRGQLVNYAINVTKAISTFLGSAIQGASNQFVNILSTGSGSLSHLFNSSEKTVLSESSSSG